MIVGCYTLDLYCRYSGMSSGPEAGTRAHPFQYLPHQFTGETFAECARKAKRIGWRFGRDDEVTCPMCTRGELK